MSTKQKWTHWQKADRPSPPPKAKTQADLDNEYFDIIFSHLGNFHAPVDYYRAGIAYERSEIAKIIKRCNDDTLYTSYDAMLEIRIRVYGGTK